MNAKIKEVGGAIGLTENETALQRWLICGPEISQLMEECKNVNESMSQVWEHHDFSDPVQGNFHKDVKSLLSVLEDFGNPFEEDSNDLFDLETKIVIPEIVAQKLHELENIRDKQFWDFIENRDWKQSVPLSDTISKSKLSLYKTVGSHST